MSFSTQFFHLLLFSATALGLVPPIANPAINLQSQPLSITNTSNAFPLIPSSTISQNGSDVDNPLFSEYDAHFLNDTNKNPHCEGAVYGYDLDKDSCLDAWRSIPTNNEIVTYGVRRKGHFEAPLPIRYLSRKSPPQISSEDCFPYANIWVAADGLCAIDINQANHVVSDAARNSEVSAGAKRLLDACVLRDPGRHFSRSIGGKLSGIGECEKRFFKN